MRSVGERAGKGEGSTNSKTAARGEDRRGGGDIEGVVAITASANYIDLPRVSTVEMIDMEIGLPGHPHTLRHSRSFRARLYPNHRF